MRKVFAFFQRRLTPLFALLLLCSFIFSDREHLTIYLAGDSTMCTYTPDRAPLTGWGMPFAGFFDLTVTVKNRAKGGRSTRTFISENRWKSIADSLQKGDYVFIQFGHNDEAKEPKYADRYTKPEDYRVNLTRFVAETRSRGANPVLVTPVTRMRFDGSGNALETHAEYAAIVREVAAQTKTPLIDLDKKSLELLRKLGPESSKLLYNQLEPGENPNYPNGIKDNTHFSELGARKMAELVLAGIRELHLGLEDRIVVRKQK